MTTQKEKRWQTIFRLVIHNPRKEYIVRTNNAWNINDMNEQIYDILIENGLPKEQAIDAAAWSELACYGESYHDAEFDIYTEEYSE